MAHPHLSTPLVVRKKPSELASSLDDFLSCSLSPQLSTPSRDSGYGSEDSTPARSSAPAVATPEIVPYKLDGSVLNSPISPEDAVPDVDGRGKDGGRLSLHAPRKDGPGTARKHKITSAPQHQYTGCTLPASFFSTPTRKSKSGYSSDSTSSSLSATSPLLSVRRPDRFVHPRDSNSTTFPLSERFRLTKPPGHLSPLEKILRHSGATADAFSLAPLRFNPMPTFGDERQAHRQSAGFPSLTRARTTLDSADADDRLEPIAWFRSRPGSVWSVGTVPPISGAIDGGNGHLVQTGTNAPYFTSDFVYGLDQDLDDDEKYAGRLVAALDFDPVSRLLLCNVDDDVFTPHRNTVSRQWTKKTKWDGATWVKEEVNLESGKCTDAEKARPLKILSAPGLKNDFYCSVLAYSSTCDVVAVGLGDLLYCWSETSETQLLNGNYASGTWLTSLAFSSHQGGKGILAFGRSNGLVGLVSMDESPLARMVIQESASVSCLSWRPTCAMRPSKSPHKTGVSVATEDLLVGYETGDVLYYIVEWPDTDEADKQEWLGDVTLAARISVHSQTICGLSWSANGASFATGGNDNVCCLFNVIDVLPLANHPGGSRTTSAESRSTSRTDDSNSRLKAVFPGGSQVRELVSTKDEDIRNIRPGMEKWRWVHSAAVKAIAFCPWQEGLVATGGGLNDRCVHFFHTTSGAALATIFVSSQVTGLVWSTTRREIAVTFGFTNPIHPFRIAVYSWPECKQVLAIPLHHNVRALCGISCSRGPARKGHESQDKQKQKAGPERAINEGCIAVASSDESIRFYQLWPSEDKLVTGGVGMLGGSDILEDLEGIQKEGDIIR